MLDQLFCLKNVFVDKLGVTFENEQAFDQTSVDLSIWLELFHDDIFFDIIILEPLLALPFALVTFKALICHATVAIRALESDIIEQYTEEFVHILLWLEFIAEHAFENTLSLRSRILFELFLTVHSKAGATTSRCAGRTL